MFEANNYHVVHRQPSTDDEILKARSALAACPVAAIRLETLPERRHRARSPQEKAQVEKSWTEQDGWVVQRMRPGSVEGSESLSGPFPRRFLDDDTLKDAYWLGHHNEASFGATPYLLRTSSEEKDVVWIMIDTPKFSQSAVRDVETLTGPDGPDFLFLTHVDDTADHNKWAHHWKHQGKGDLKRILHSGELGNNWLGDSTLEHVEMLLPEVENEQGLTPYNLRGETLSLDWQESHGNQIVILHTPGHSPGSITLYRPPDQDNNEPGILFTGDTYAWTLRDGGKMTGFGRYGNDLRKQAKTLEELLKLDWDVIAPGHGHPRDYRHSDNTTDSRKLRRQEELKVALDDLMVSRRW